MASSARAASYALLKREPKLEPLGDVQWRSPASDLPARRRVVQQVLRLLQAQRAPGDEGLALVAKRVELALYARAASLSEYAAVETLRRRVQALVAASFHEAHASEDVAVSALAKRFERDVEVAARPNKRRRASSHVLFPLLANEDVARAVFSFLDGKDVLQLRVLNSAADALLPSCVFSIRLEVSQLHAALVAPHAPLAALSSLRQLVVYKPENQVLTTPNSPSDSSPVSIQAPLYAWSCAELAPTADNDGELAVGRLAQVLHELPKLESLQLPAVFCNTTTRNAVKALADALADGACPKLRDLVLGGNHLADAGAAELARAIESGNLTQLQRLDVRRNYMSDRGVATLLDALSRNAPRSLRALSLGGNLVTDESVSPVVALVARAQLVFLGLEDNFLTPTGVERVVRSAQQ